MTSYGLLLAGANEVRVVTLSIVMAITSAYTALRLARNAASAPRNEKKRWLAATAGIIAVGIWAVPTILDGAVAGSLRNAAIAAVVLSFLIGTAATAASDKRFLSRTLRRLSMANRTPNAAAISPARNATPSDLLALNATLTRAANSVLVPGDLQSPSMTAASAEGLEGDPVQSQPSATAVNSQLPK
ncbi:MAG: hypothetical protein WAM39_17370 [Bryobacteraceae bacterium]